MLVELTVENYAVVERARIRFGPGLNVLTGETGSGKSIVVDALGLLFGARASAEALRTGASRARVWGIFEAPESAAALLAEAGIESEDGELLVEREILASGKSRAFVASRPVTASVLRDLSVHLGDIHGQHDQQQLFSPDAQLGLLDDFAADEALVARARAAYGDWKACARELEELDRNEGERLRLLDLWNFQRNELEAASLKAGEDEELGGERRILQNVAKLTEGASAAWEALYEAEHSAHAQIRTALKRLEDLARVDEGLGPVLDALRPAEIAVDDAAATLRDYLAKLEADPERLEDIETRLAALDKLKRKYGGSVEEMIAFLEDVRGKIAAVESGAERRAAVAKRREEVAREYTAAAAALTTARTEAARRLERSVEKELKSLAMERAVFRVALAPAEWSASGADAVQFLFSANAGEEPRPLEKVASGGELSRVALALKTCAAGGARSRTLVFDEVDAGIGGAAADSVGKRLKRLAATQQVLCVTHLAQIAGFADHHFAVEKRESKGRTVAEVQPLSGDARTEEISRMLSGRVTPEALRHAEQLIRGGS